MRRNIVLRLYDMNELTWLKRHSKFYGNNYNRHSWFSDIDKKTCIFLRRFFYVPLFDVLLMTSIHLFLISEPRSIMLVSYQAWVFSIKECSFVVEEI